MDLPGGGRVEIIGGVGRRDAAAIVAAVAQALEEEAAARAVPQSRPHQSGWVLSWRPRPVHVPLPSHAYDALAGWSPPDEEDDDGSGSPG